MKNWFLYAYYSLSKTGRYDLISYTFFLKANIIRKGCLPVPAVMLHFTWSNLLVEI